MSKTETPAIALAPFPWVGLLTLSVAIFLAITSEMLPTGLLPEMSADLGVTQSQVGLLVTWFAFAVVVTSIPLAQLTKRMPRHGLVLAVLVLFALSNVLTAVGPSYEFIVASRVLGGMAHGVFWSTVGAYAAHLVPKAQIGRAVSITIAGGSLAFVFGVPLATVAGQLLGWRLAFLLLAGCMLVGAALVWRFLPRVEHHHGTKSAATPAAPADVAEPRRDPTLPTVLLVCVIAFLLVTSHYTFYTYIVPFLRDEMLVSAESVAPLLFTYGIAGAVGLLLSGTIFGPRPQLGLILSISIAALSLTVLGLFAAQPILALPAFVAWGIAFGVIPPMMQTRLLHTASRRIRDTASAIYTTSFNAGIGGGALLGALLLDAFGVATLPFVYVGILLAALLLVVLSDVVLRRRTGAPQVTLR